MSKCHNRNRESTVGVVAIRDPANRMAEDHVDFADPLGQLGGGVRPGKNRDRLHCSPRMRKARFVRHLTTTFPIMAGCSLQK
jgi:hypothetical protein